MERSIRLVTATRAELLRVIEQQRATLAAHQQTIARLEALAAQQQQVITQQQATIADLEQRVAEVEQRLGPGGGPPKGFPGHKPQQTPPPPPERRPRKGRPHGFARRRTPAPDAVVVHAVAHCPACQTRMVGGWLKRRRQVMEVVLAPAQVVEHQYWERQCAVCRKRWTPRGELAGQAVLGQGRLGVDLLALIAALREQGRLPIETIRWYLATFHGLSLSAGAVVGALRQVAQRGEAAVARSWERLRASPVVHADETGWREQGRNGYIWSFSTPQERCFLFGRRTKDMVDRGVGPDFAGVLVTDFYAAYDHYPGEHQRCWAHLLRDIHDVQQKHPQDVQVSRWARRLHGLYRTAKGLRGAGVAARERLERTLLQIVEPFVQETAAPQRVVSKRVVDYLKELFVFVVNPLVPPDNNAAERSIRPLVTGRKVSGGTRSAEGTATKMALATLFGTWHVRGLNPFLACRQMLTSP
jgi:hypothetical protein